jgi:hypothetical protein
MSATIEERRKAWTEWKNTLFNHLKQLIPVLEKVGVPRAEAAEIYFVLRDELKDRIRHIHEDIDCLIREAWEEEEEEGREEEEEEAEA